MKSYTFTNFKDTKLKILNLKSIAKLKIVALVMRDKSRDLRDLFNFRAILENDILSFDELIELFYKLDNKINSKKRYCKFYQNQKRVKRR